MELSINKISKKIGNTNVIKDFTYTFISNEVYLILGNNGSGKTTILKCISSLYSLDSGYIQYQDTKIDNIKKLKFYRTQVSLFFEATKSLIPSLTGLQNIQFYLGLNNVKYKEVKNYITE